MPPEKEGGSLGFANVDSSRIQCWDSTPHLGYRATGINVTLMAWRFVYRPMPREKEFVLLRNDDRAWLRHLSVRHTKRSGRDRTKLSRLRGRARAALEDLSYLAETLPEDQQEQVFTPVSILPFVYALLARGKREKTERHYRLAAMLAEWSIPIMKDKLDTSLGSFLWKDFLRVDEIIRMIVPEIYVIDGKPVFPATINEKLVFSAKPGLRL
jgi:hypothetical protein